MENTSHEATGSRRAQPSPLQLLPLQTPTPELLPLEVLIHGQSFGRVEPFKQDRHRWHALIYAPLPRVHGGSCKVLIQGFGPTPDDAISDAVLEALEYHRDCLRAVEMFAAQMEGKS